MAFAGYCYHERITVYGCGFTATLSKSKNSHNGLRTNVAIQQTRILMIPTKGATKAYHNSQSLIASLETAQFVGAGEGTDNQDFLADLSTLEVIDPDSKGSRADSQSEEVLLLEVPIQLLEHLNSQIIPHAHCVRCNSEFRVLKQLRTTTCRFTMW